MMRSASETLTRPALTSVKNKTDVGRFQAVDNLLSAFGYDFLFDESLQQETITSSIAKLRDYQKARGLSRIVVSEIESEVIAGTCTLSFDKGLSRKIAVQALELRRTDDNHILIHVGTWKRNRGMRVTCFLPGGKQEAGVKAEVHMKQHMQNRLSWLLHDYHIKLTKNDSSVSTKPSDRYGITTTCDRIVFEGLACKRTDLEDDDADEGKEKKHDPLVVEFTSNRKHAGIDPASSTAGISSDEAQSDESPCLESTPAWGIFTSRSEALVYAWIHPDLWSAKQSQDPAFSERMKAWASSFEQVIENYTQGMEFLERNFLQKIASTGRA